MLGFDLLGIALAHRMSSRRQVTFIDPRPIRVEVLQAKGLEQLLQLDKDRIRATPERIRQAHPTQMITRMPPPALVGFPLHETPPFLHLRGFHAPHFDRARLWTAALHDAGVDLGEAGRFFLIRALP